MIPVIKLVVSQNDTVIQSVSREVDSKHFVKTLENFQEIANATLTKMIDDQGGSGECILEEDDDESDPDEDAYTSRPKKKKR